MADEFQIGSGNWWDSSRNRFGSGSSSSSTSLTSIGSFGWATEIADIKARSSMDSGSVSGSSNVFQDTQKIQGADSAGGGGALADGNLQMMGLGLSSHPIDWNQSLLRSGKAESSFRTLLQEDLSSNASYRQESGMQSSQEHWRQKIYAGSCDDSPVEFKQINRGFSLDQPQLSSHISSSDSTMTCQGLTTSFQMDSALYGSPSTMLQGLVVSDNQPQQSSFENKSMNYQYPQNYGINSGEQLGSWSKYSQLIRTSPPRQQQPPHSQLHFSNNAPFWNASAAAMNDVRSNFYPTLQTQIPTPSFDEKPKNKSEVRELGTVAKKSSNEPSTKRPRTETTTPIPAFKVRKEKMGDRITALQQLVSPFGKTDTASVLSEAIEYIKFLHDQVSVLSTPYMKTGAPIQNQQNCDKSKDTEGPKQDLRSRGLCLVPVSSTYPMTHESTPVEFWNPTFGGTFR